MNLNVRKPSITKEWILNRVTEYDIYRKFFGDFELNRKINNHLRGERIASFIIGTKYGTITHIDFADEYWKGNCFNLVQQIYRCSFGEALEIIAKEFGLIDGEPIKVKWEQPKIIESKPTEIQVITKKFTKKELDYWAEYFQGEDDLKRENIYSIREVWIDKARMRLYDHYLSFAYYYADIEKFKLYCPEDPIVNGTSWKWRTNCDFDYIEHLDKIASCERVFISKSKKDRMVLRSALGMDCIITTQSENPACFKDETISFLKENTKEQITIFDADEPGVRNSWYMTNNFGFKHCNVPYYYVKKGIKDFADLGRVYGLERVRKHFESKNYI